MSARRRKRRARRDLQLMARKGMRGYPLATVDYYGPDEEFATEVVLRIIPGEGEKPTLQRQWHSEKRDVRWDPEINRQIADLVETHHVKSVILDEQVKVDPELMSSVRPELLPEREEERWEEDDAGPISGVIVAIGWYRSEQWERLREVSVDKEALQESYEEWLKNAKKLERELKRQRLQVVRVEVDVEELVEWCRAKGRPVDGKTRSEFASEKARELGIGAG